MNMNDPIASLLGGWSTELNLYSVLLRVGRIRCFCGDYRL